MYFCFKCFGADKRIRKYNKMKRYEIIGDPTFELMEFEDGGLMLYQDFYNFIFRRIEELEKQKFDTTTKHGVYDFNMNSAVINELKNLIK